MKIERRSRAEISLRNSPMIRGKNMTNANNDAGIGS